MSSPFLGEIRIVAFNFPPSGWLLCNGQTLSINTYQALFALLGTTYGGNGITTFALRTCGAARRFMWEPGLCRDKPAVSCL